MERLKRIKISKEARTRETRLIRLVYSSSLSSPCPYLFCLGCTGIDRLVSWFFSLCSVTRSDLFFLLTYCVVVVVTLLLPSFVCVIRYVAADSRFRPLGSEPKNIQTLQTGNKHLKRNEKKYFSFFLFSLSLTKPDTNTDTEGCAVSVFAYRCVCINIMILLSLVV